MTEESKKNNIIAEKEELIEIHEDVCEFMRYVEKSRIHEIFSELTVQCFMKNNEDPNDVIHDFISESSDKCKKKEEESKEQKEQFKAQITELTEKIESLQKMVARSEMKLQEEKTKFLEILRLNGELVKQNEKKNLKRKKERSSAPGRLKCNIKRPKNYDYLDSSSDDTPTTPEESDVSFASTLLSDEESPSI